MCRLCKVHAIQLYASISSEHIIHTSKYVRIIKDTLKILTTMIISERAIPELAGS